VPLRRLVEEGAQLLHGALIGVRCDGVLLEEIRVDTTPQCTQRPTAAVARRHERMRGEVPKISLGWGAH